ncbi:trigger factor [Zwartia vadi]|uniref:trigger factor n=1 Tax=Zwartia vadi TaxID=3058168 RepID=UPI0025B55C9D|nr:trigger factor [Zwartia vadi]MDN3986373.1 trigger factor [Zwartia vadi]
MQPVVETLSGLERRIEISVLLADVEKAVQAELKRVSRTAKAPGFRPGKVPMAMLERTHAAGIRYDTINSKVGQAFEQAIEASGLRIAGAPKLEPKTEGTPEGTLAFYAVFEVYPEVTLPDLSTLKIKRAVTPVGDAEVQSTVDILRKQRAEYVAREGRAATDEDRVTLDFAGTIEGVPFDGGKAEDFPFVLGQGRMLPEFEVAVRGLKAGESKVFTLVFPADYGSKDVAGKTAEFTIKVKEVAEPILPVVDAEFAKSLGQTEGDVEKLMADIRGNIEREVKARTLARTKNSVMDALISAASFDVPKSLVESECQARVQAARAELTQRGVPNADKMPIPADAFTAEAERRVRLGLLVSELVQKAQLQAKPEQVRARIEEFAANYEKPAEVVSYYLSDRARRSEVEGIVLEDNVVQHALAQAQVEDEQVPFDQVMGTT